MREHCPPYRGRRPMLRRSGTTKLKFYRGLPKKTDNPRGCGDSVKVCLLFGESGGMSDAEENPEYGYCKIPRQQKQRTVNPPSNAHVGSNPTSPTICRSSSMVERRTLGGIEIYRVCNDLWLLTRVSRFDSDLRPHFERRIL